jgi:hypothetical protein
MVPKESAQGNPASTWVPSLYPTPMDIVWAVSSRIVLSILASTAPGVEAFSSRRENRKVTVNYGDAAAALSHESYHHARRQRIFSLGCQYRQCRYESYEAHLSLRRYGHSVSSRGFAQTTSHHRTNDYKNARLTPKGREALNVHSLPRITEASASSASSARTEWTTP